MVKTACDNTLKGEPIVHHFSCNSARDDGFQFYIKLYLQGYRVYLLPPRFTRVYALGFVLLAVAACCVACVPCVPCVHLVALLP